MTLSAKELLERGITTKDAFSSQIIERGKLAPNVAYELSYGKGLLRVGESIRPDRYKVEIVFYDEAENEIKRDIGISTEYEIIARKFITQRREHYIKQNNKKITVTKKEPKLKLGSQASRRFNINLRKPK